MRYHALDPGLNGVWAALDRDGAISEIVELPHVYGRGGHLWLDARTLVEWVERDVAVGDIVALEAFWLRSRTAASIRSLRNHERLYTAFELGGAFPIILPAKDWRAAMGLPVPGGTYDERKQASVDLAAELWNYQVRHDAAEALLMAETIRRRYERSGDS
jgi:hypothetical protein